MVQDDYKEHEQHIKGAQGKIVPFWKNMAHCSTCYSAHRKIKNIGRVRTFNSIESKEDFRHENYKI